MMAVVIIVQLWVSLGTSFLTMRAGFSTVDRSIVEAGLVDGIKKSISGALAHYFAGNDTAFDFYRLFYRLPVLLVRKQSLRQ